MISILRNDKIHKMEVVPQDHKNLIYECMDIHTLISLGKTCKTFLHDEHRKRSLAKKVIDEYVYTSIYDSPVLASEHFGSHQLLDYLCEFYFGRLNRISVCDLATMTLDDSIVPFNMFEHLFTELSQDKKLSIIKNVFDFMKDLFLIADKNKCCVYMTQTYNPKNPMLRQMGFSTENTSFKYANLFLSLDQIVKRIFRIDKSKLIRFAIIEQIKLFDALTAKKETEIFILDVDPNNLESSYYTNDYTLSYFLENLELKVSDLSEIVDIGLFLSGSRLTNYNIAEFIAHIFDDFTYVEQGYNDKINCLSEEIKEQLKDTDLNNNLKFLFTVSGFDYQLFLNAVDFRWKQWLHLK